MAAIPAAAGIISSSNCTADSALPAATGPAEGIIKWGGGGGGGGADFSTYPC